MRESYIFSTMEKYRNRLVQLADKCPVDKRNTVPDGFKNSIHWQLGHILTIMDIQVYGFAGAGLKLDESYKTFFGNGTKPADWTAEPPSWETIVAQLQKQIAQIRADFSGKLNQAAKENYMAAETIVELLLGAFGHEREHYGNINAMLKILVQDR